MTEEILTDPPAEQNLFTKEEAETVLSRISSGIQEEAGQGILFSCFTIDGTKEGFAVGLEGLTWGDFRSGYRGYYYQASSVIDAEKCTSIANDDMMCWAGAAANMLYYTDWGLAETEDEDCIFSIFIDNFLSGESYGGSTCYGLEWFLTGDYLPANWQFWDHPVEGSGGFYSSSFANADLYDYLFQQRATADGVTAAKEKLEEGYAVGVSFSCYTSSGTFKNSHAVTVWGFTYDTSLSVTDPDYYTGIIITDSDDSKNRENACDAPDTLKIISMTYDDTRKRYLLDPEYGRAEICPLDTFVFLAPNPGFTQNLSSAGNEGVMIYSGTTLISKTSSAVSRTLSAGGSAELMLVTEGGRVSHTLAGSGGTLCVSSGGITEHTRINSSGAVHIYSGGTAYDTTVNRNGYFGIGNGATAYDTTIGYAGELTVWGGGTVERNTIDTYGAIILSSGALAKETSVNSLGGLHVYSGAVASNTTIKEGGMLGAGLGATVYETKLDSFGKATLWGGATANTTSIGYAGELTVLSGGYTNGNIIDTWGAVILSSGAVGNSTTILASGGYHIYNGAVAYTTMVTSGAQLGIGLGGTVYNLDIQTGANATFYDGSILRGWNDFAGSVTVNEGVDAAGSMINFDISGRSASHGVIISNASGITGASYYISVDTTQAAGRYYLAGNAANISSLTITGTDTVLFAGGEGVTFSGSSFFSLNWDENENLYLDIAKLSAGSFSDDPDTGSWDDAAVNMAFDAASNEEKKEASTGFLAIF